MRLVRNIYTSKAPYSVYEIGFTIVFFADLIKEPKIGYCFVFYNTSLLSTKIISLPLLKIEVNL